MKKLLTVIPIPITGLLLGIVALSNLFYGLQLKFIGHLFLVTAIILLLLLCLKMIIIPQHLIEAINNPVVASILPTFTMSLLLISGILRNLGFNELFVNLLWIFSSFVQIIFVLYYIYRFIIKEKVTMQSVIPGWFVTFVGLAMITINAPDFAYIVGSLVFFVTSTALIILLPLVLKRVFIMRDLPIPVKPMITILTAPTSLTLVAYLAHFNTINETLVIAIVVVAQLLYFIVLYELQTLIKMPFYPSFGAFTFPLVVSATGLLLVQDYFRTVPDWLEMLVYFETIIGTSIVLFVIFKFVQYIVRQMEIKNENVASSILKK